MTDQNVPTSKSNFGALMAALLLFTFAVLSAVAATKQPFLGITAASFWGGGCGSLVAARRY
jgi:hypothetical protein